MPSSLHLSQSQRSVLAEALASRLVMLRSQHASQPPGLTQAERSSLAREEDAGEAMQRAGDREVEALVADIDSAEADAIEAALHRIHGIGYGRCAECDVAIPFERLRVEPQALRCVPCQTLREEQTA